MWIQAAKLKDRFVVPSFLLIFGLFAYYSLRSDSVTSDEVAHLPAGFTYLDRGDFRLNPEHPPLAKAWAALPLWIGGLRSPDYSSLGWSLPDQWAFGYEFLHGEGIGRQRVDPMRLLVPGRLFIVLLGAFLGGVVFMLGREMVGRPAAYLALLLFVLSPTILAHSRLVTTDIPAALGFILSVWTFRRACLRPSPLRVVVAGVSLGVAFLMKFSMVLLCPILLFLGAVWVLDPGASGEERPIRLRRAVLVLGAIGFTAWVCLWAGYGFRFQASQPGGPRLAGQERGLTGLALQLHLVPEAYGNGVSTISRSLHRQAYLNGELGTGWWYYFPEALLLKSTPALLAFLGIGLVRLLWRQCRSPGPWTFDDWVLALPPVVYFATAMASGMNIGHRHLVPIYPFLFLAAGKVGQGLLMEGPRARWVVAALLTCHASSSISAFPGYLSYFNLAAGGARGGHRFLLDSNLDWGQDLLRLSRLLRKEGIQEVHLLACHESGDPVAYGVRYRHRLVPYQRSDPEPDFFPGPGETVAVSLSLLYGLYVDSPRVRSFMETLRGMTPVGTAGDSIRLYRMPRKMPP